MKSMENSPVFYGFTKEREEIEQLGVPSLARGPPPQGMADDRFIKDAMLDEK